MTFARALDRSSRPSSPVKRNALFPFAMTARCHPLTALVLVAAFRGVSAAESASTHPRIFQIARPTADHSSLEVVEEGLRRLEAVSEPISIVAVVGGFHSGKSFLCNVLNRSTSGFELGPTHEATTMGLWLGETAERSASDGSRVFLLDTEGFSAPGVAESYDAQVFAVAALLSSHLVYNSVKLITAAEVEYLETLARRAKLWSLQPDFRGDARSAFPPLTWVVEDFTAEMRFVTPTEWLLSFLGEGDAIEGGRVARRPLVDGNYTMTRLFERARGDAVSSGVHSRRPRSIAPRAFRPSRPGFSRAGGRAEDGSTDEHGAETRGGDDGCRRVGIDSSARDVGAEGAVSEFTFSLVELGDAAARSRARRRHRATRPRVREGASRRLLRRRRFPSSVIPGRVRCASRLRSRRG